MLAVQKNDAPGYESKPIAKIRTTLYDLIAAVQEEVRPGEEHLVGEIVLQILKKYGVRFQGDLLRGALALK